MAFNPSLKKVVPVTEEQLVTFDYYDTLRNTGYVAFYPCSLTSGANLEIVTETGIASTDIGKWSEPVFWMQDPGGSALVSRALTQTADLTFNLPLMIKGDIFLNVPLGCANHSSTDPLQLVVSGAIYKINSAGTQTLINGVNPMPVLRYEIGTINIAEAKVALCKFNTSGAITFAAGDKLRIHLDVYGKTLGPDAGQQSYVTICYDPANRSLASDSTFSASGATFLPSTAITRQTFLVPFKLT